VERDVKAKVRSILRIDHGVPAPKERGRYRELMGELKVGDSVLFPPDAQRSAYNAAHGANNYKGYAGRRFICREMDNGYRVWRIK
jgi:hypothetical protein